MSSFETNTQKALDIFKEILPSYEIRKEFLSHIDDSVSSYEKLELKARERMDLAIQLLVENARVTETRKMQQQNFGPALAILRQEPENIVTHIKNDELFFIQLIQLSVIFLHVHEIESENHSHETIRVTLKKTLAKIIPLL